MEAYHTPVLVKEALVALGVKSGGSYIDCTLGLAGHALAILDAASEARLLGLEMDTEALELARSRLETFPGRAVGVQANFADVDEIAEDNGFKPADGVLFDLGLSSLQVDSAGRGFSFRLDAKLDMRFDTTQTVTAYDVINRHSEASLADCIFRLGEEPRARRIAAAIVRSRPIETTAQLAEVVIRAVGRRPGSRIHPSTRTFMAIRMLVNKELENLGQGLVGAIDVLDTGARLAVISYHSTEDRLVKGILRTEASSCVCPPGMPQCVCGHVPTIRLVSRRVIKPTPAEIEANPRSRSARMRVAERI